MLDLVVICVVGVIAIFGVTYAIWGITRSWIDYRRGLIGEELDKFSVEGGDQDTDNAAADRTPSHTV